jgi:hypothetical protein
MCGEAGDRIQALLEAGEGNPAVEEFGEILCARWLADVRSGAGRGAADGRLIAGLESLVDWAGRKGLLPGALAEALIHTSV